MASRSINFTTIQCIFLSFFWIALCCIAEINQGGAFGDVYGGLANKTREFDYFMLSLLWPGTDCRNTRHCCPSNACCHRSNSLTEFTIHGLWTDYNDGTWPACCSGKRFDVKEISMLLSDLNKYWPSLSCDSPTNCHGGKGLFWEHEWEKHGTCSSPVIQDEYSYFTTTLNLYFQYNVTEVLRKAGYIASNSETYPLGGIVAAIQNAFYATPQLVCSGDAVGELRLCFYKDLKIQDCTVESVTEPSCPSYVRLPDVSSNELNFVQHDTS